MVDHHHRVVISHGVNLVWTLVLYFPPNNLEGFTAADWLVEHGFNSVLIGSVWTGVSPSAPGQIDQRYLIAWDRVVQLFAEPGLWILFDFHQDMLGGLYQGEDAPELGAYSGVTTTVMGLPALDFPFATDFRSFR
ncbi:hypothetical protein [Zhongshania sp.]|uniref:hypothetical protein n=1 Tax=Zhongshania sp. TaxID=1971902 RepID=UPI0035644F6C